LFIQQLFRYKTGRVSFTNKEINNQNDHTSLCVKALEIGNRINNYL
jgi:hypothetical protein